MYRDRSDTAVEGSALAVWADPCGHVEGDNIVERMLGYRGNLPLVFRDEMWRLKNFLIPNEKTCYFAAAPCVCQKWLLAFMQIKEAYLAKNRLPNF